MTTLLQRLGWRGEALAWDAYQGMFRAMGLERASVAGSALLRRIGPLSGAHHVARVNMRIAFPDAHERELDSLLDAMWDNFGRVLGEFPNMDRFDMSVRSQQVTVEGAEILEDIGRSKAPTVLFSGHFANWEMIGATLAQHLKSCRITYRHANNPIIDRRIIAQRQAYGVRILTPKGGSGAKEMLAALQAGNPVGLMNDQKMNDGIAAPFFGRPAMTASGPARLAQRYDAPLVPMSVRRVEGTRFHVKVHEPLDTPEGSGNEAILQTVTRINEFIEARILEAPEQWFWVHRRFEKPLYKKPK
ncbi:lysophospholipid acyltransferase family protein [Marinicauda pacifica]|jgi:KDO2-lipid IV(A) lauroyltransferase|uniref:lysophospholipid acyltransferase family protein n=1 Tax=Marinicauda pacifica TaxID=1133559 RepID=UPI0035C7B4EA